MVDKHVLRWVGAVAVVVVLFFIIRSLFSSPGKQAPKGSSGGWTVYGTDSCGWTTKQLKELDSKGVAYTYVNCANGGCDGISGYPTLKNDDGTVKVGYTPM